MTKIMVDENERKQNVAGCPTIPKEKKDEVVKLYNEGLMKKEIAKRVGISFPTVKKIIDTRS